MSAVHSGRRLVKGFHLAVRDDEGTDLRQRYAYVLKYYIGRSILLPAVLTGQFQREEVQHGRVHGDGGRGHVDVSDGNQQCRHGDPPAWIPGDLREIFRICHSDYPVGLGAEICLQGRQQGHSGFLADVVRTNLRVYHHGLCRPGHHRADRLLPVQLCRDGGQLAV